MTHPARNTERQDAERASYRRGRHWAAGEAPVLHPGRLADCALCLTSNDPLEVSPLY